ncbi:MAG: hypothetical protein ACXWC2_07130 [Ramlibacter sp.]
MILNPTALILLENWEQAHRQACQAEAWVGRDMGDASTTSSGVAQTAAELRSIADAIFRQLLQCEAFGKLRPMPGDNPDRSFQ